MPHLLTPSGSNQPFEETEAVEITDADARDAVDAFNDAFRAYLDLLISIIEDAETVYDAFSFTGSDWEFNDVSKIYRNILSEQLLNATRQVRLREQLTQKQIANVRRLSVELRDGKITVQQFRRTMQRRIKRLYTQQWALAKGGMNALTAADLVNIQNQVGVQYGFLDNFTEQIRGGELSFRQIRNRSEMYMHSGTQAYERGRASSYRLDLPAYPADGSQICLSRCKCHWEFDKDANGFPIAYWRLDFAAEHCETCLSNRRVWSPFRG